ncbi:isocitrate lyase/phosphoenolpyruvate mutase family protein [Nocardioides zeae]|uniref:Isocitrate lyase/phosphoenolpyruvate mutase family protein n=1 Tax=Nocardioides imazamoxiresistens TaxID=3231893 RepID=A0ABU3Q0P8_9ACTN|nr:isocitrate lyase/phosphoenolpyruvate mutase family protein [Nocardioides zeae]MDT9594627.1 isocitrate lyase/phosphoenolpyruvate mutase family protein [Nocardioides zeae]
MTSTAAAATTLLRLHQAPELLTVVNVWDAVSAQVVTGVQGTTALATASHSIAASRGYEDGENIPVAEMIEEVRRIVAATHLPVTADLEGGYGDAPGTVRRAIEVGVVGANLEDQLKPLAEAAAQVEAVMEAARDAGVPDFVLNARTDAFVLGADDPLAEAVERGRAYLDAGAPTVFVPGPLDEDQVATLVDAFGPQKLTVIGLPGVPSPPRLQELGVARVSYGPLSQRVALTALAELVESVHDGGGVPEGTRPLN